MKDLDLILSLIGKQRAFLNECDIVPAEYNLHEIENVVLKLKLQQSLIVEPLPFANFSI